MAGDLEFGIAQADRQYQPTTAFRMGRQAPRGSPRRVRVAPERHFRRAEIPGTKSLKDAKGKVVNIGNPGLRQPPERH